MKRYYKGSSTVNPDYQEVLTQLKKAIARHDDQLLHRLQRSPYYDRAVSEIRDCMQISASDESWLGFEEPVIASDDSEIEASYWYYGGDQPYMLVCESAGWVVYDNYHNKVAGPYDSWAYAEDWCDSTNEDYSN